VAFGVLEVGILRLKRLLRRRVGLVDVSFFEDFSGTLLVVVY